MTSEQAQLLASIVDVLEDDPRVEAAWLAGSLGRGAGDAFSDVDVLVQATADAPGELGESYASRVSEIAELVLVNVLYGGRVVSAVTADWGRFDLSFVTAAELARYDAAVLEPLFNRGEASPPVRTPQAYAPSPETVRPLIEEFMRVQGLLPLGVGREEWLVALSGVEILRRLAIDLMLEANGVSPADRGGALSRNPLLTPAQRAALEALPPAAADRDSVIAANLAIAAVFLPEARALAGRMGLAWPDALEAALRRRFRATLGVDLP